MIESAIFTELTTAIGTAVSNRIYPLVAPQPATAPLCVYNIVTRQLEHSLDGPGTLYHTHFQVDVYSMTLLEASTIANSVVSAMSAWSSFHVHVDDAGTQMIEETVQPNLYRVSMRFIVHHRGA